MTVETTQRPGQGEAVEQTGRGMRFTNWAAGYVDERFKLTEQGEVIFARYGDPAIAMRHIDQVAAAVEQTVKTFGAIDICINNASAIQLTGTLETPMKRFDLMHQINARGTFMVSQKCIPHLLKAANPHVLNLSPPLDFDVKWFANHPAYTLAKYGMSVFAWSMAAEFKDKGLAFNCLWPRTAIATSAIQNILGGDEGMKQCRKPEIMADAAHAIFTRPARDCTGNFFIDDEVLAAEGVTDFDKYAVSPGTKLMPDFFVPAPGARTVVGKA